MERLFLRIKNWWRNFRYGKPLTISSCIETQGNWSNIILQIDGNKVDLYVDGKLMISKLR